MGHETANRTFVKNRNKTKKLQGAMTCDNCGGNELGLEITGRTSDREAHGELSYDLGILWKNFNTLRILR